MNCCKMIGLVCGVATLGFVLGGCAGGGQKLASTPPEQDMQIYMQSGMPGEMHKMMAEGVGNWTTTNTMWMAPDAPPMVTKGSAVTKMSMDGRFAVTEVTSPMGEGMSMTGISTMGFDNVQKKFVGTWIDNMGSGIMQGVGTPSQGGKRIEWVYTYSCPITNSQRTMREIHTRPDKDTLIIESFAKDPRTNKEMQCMRMEAKRAS